MPATIAAAGRAEPIRGLARTEVVAASKDGHDVVRRGGPRGPLAGWLAIGLAVAIPHPEAHAGECAPATPECHLENGQDLLETDPRRAAEELLASYQLDERTDTLALYATALQRDRRHAHALETWQRVIVFRESELDAARATARRATGRKRAAARAAVRRAQKQTEQAAEAIIKLWPSVGRVRVRIAAGQQLAVSRGGAEVDVSRDVLVNAGRDELAFTRKDGSVKRVVVEVAAGALAQIDAPPEPVAERAPQQPRRPGRSRPARPKPAMAAEQPMPALAATRLVEEPRSITMSRVGLGLVAGAVVAGGIAGGLGYLADRDLDRSRELGCSLDGQCPVGPAADRAGRSNDRARLAQLSAIGGGALLATGVTLWIVGRGKTRRAATDISLRVAPSSAAIAWRF
jgi:hypothetical protein